MATLELSTKINKCYPGAYFSFNTYLSLQYQEDDESDEKMDIAIDSDNIDLTLYVNDEINESMSNITISSDTKIKFVYKNTESNEITLTVSQEDEVINDLSINVLDRNLFWGQTITSEQIEVIKNDIILHDGYDIIQPYEMPYTIEKGSTSLYIVANYIDPETNILLSAILDIPVNDDLQNVVTKQYLESQLKLTEYHRYMHEQLAVPFVVELTQEEYDNLENLGRVLDSTLYLITE